MTTLDQLEALAKKVINAAGQMQIIDANYDYATKANPATILALIELCKQQHEALKDIRDNVYRCERSLLEETAGEALAAFENFGKE